MKISNNLAFEYIQTTTPQITALSEDFLKNFGLTTFIYARHYYDGTYIFHSTCLDWVKNWLDTIHTVKNTPLEKSYKETPLKAPHYFLWDTEPQSKLIQTNNHFGLWHGFDIYYRLEDSIEGWSFSTSQEHQEMNNFYFNNLKLFHRFCLYLREAASTLFDITDKSKLAVFKENCDFSFQSSNTKIDEVNNFVSSLPLHGCTLHLNKGTTTLSRRELECMLYFSQGKTAKGIAKLLNITPRTVETHFMHIKQKTSYHDKSALADNLRENVFKWL